MFTLKNLDDHIKIFKSRTWIGDGRFVLAVSRITKKLTIWEKYMSDTGTTNTEKYPPIQIAINIFKKSNAVLEYLSMIESNNGSSSGQKKSP